MPEQSTPGHTIYVGYLPLSARHRKFVRLLVTGLFCWLGVMAVILTTTQRNPGPAVWDSAAEQHWSGVIRLEPYPMLEVEGEGSYLIVGMGKYGVADRVSPFADMSCRVKGYRLARASRRMIELSPDLDAIAAIHDQTVPRGNSTNTRRQITLITEIVDGKCYLGAMKPGDGKTHKACATLCLMGGLPPLVVTNNTPTESLFPLLRVDGSTKLEPAVLALVAQPVRIEGWLSESGGLPVLDTTAAHITPID